MRLPMWLVLSSLAFAAACSETVDFVEVPPTQLRATVPGTLEMGQTAQATAVVQDAQGRSLSGWDVQWSSSDSTVAVVDARTGMVTGLSAGSATISAAGGGHTGSAVVRVTWPAPARNLAGTLSAGQVHTCALDARGYAYCWGINNFGQLGNNSTVGAPAPVRVATDVRFVAISAGSVHTCAISATDRGVYCWGYTESGRLGNGVTQRSNLPTPQRVSDQSAYVAIDVGGAHACGLTDQGKVKCWGQNEWGQMGAPDQANCQPLPHCMSVPTEVQSSQQFSSIAVGYLHSCGATVGGQVYCWGDNEYGQLGGGSISGGSCPQFGSNTSSCSTAPVLVTLPQGEFITRVVAGLYHSCALSRGGRLYCWGRNNLGQLGDGSTTDRSTPVQPPTPPGVVFVDAGGSQTCAVAGGPMDCWGDNSGGQLGDGTTNAVYGPLRITPPYPVRIVSLGELHSCSIDVSSDLMSGGIYCWGLNNFGQLGTSSSETCGSFSCSTHPLAVRLVPAQASGSTAVVDPRGAPVIDSDAQSAGSSTAAAARAVGARGSSHGSAPPVQH